MSPWRTGTALRWRAWSQKAGGTAERDAAQAMLRAKRKAVGDRITAGADKAYDAKDHGETLPAFDGTPHVAQNNRLTKTGRRRSSAIDGRTTRHESYHLSQKRRKMIECMFGGGKQHGTMRQTKHRGIAKVAADFLLQSHRRQPDPHSAVDCGVRLRGKIAG
jgi:hypothetical protein